jgi:hypothetical protein
VRRIVSTPASFTAVDALEGWFPANLAPPEDPPPLVDLDQSPRDLPPTRLQYAGSTLHPGDAAPRRVGERVEILDVTYELLGRPRQISTGRRVVGYEVAVTSVAELYPHVAILQENNGDEVLPEISLAVWSLSENIVGRSGYEDLESEAPIDYADVLRPNRVLSISGTRHHITRAYVPPGQPRVRMSIRRRDRNG